jgi:hypothetical protein
MKRTPLLHCLRPFALVAVFCLVLANTGCRKNPSDGDEQNTASGSGGSLEKISDGISQVLGRGQLPPIKGLSLGMPIYDAVAVMNEKAGPLWADNLGRQSVQPYKVMKVPANSMEELRLQIKQLMALATMQLYAADPLKPQDLYIVVPSNGPDTAQGLADVGIGVLQSLLLTGFFAWSGEDGKINMFIIGPTLGNALFNVSPLMSTEQFAGKFAEAYNISWSQPDDIESANAYLYESSSGQCVALTGDELQRRTVVVWDSTTSAPMTPAGGGSFD